MEGTHFLLTSGRWPAPGWVFPHLPGASSVYARCSFVPQQKIINEYDAGTASSFYADDAASSTDFGPTVRSHDSVTFDRSTKLSKS